ncbi:MAG: DUF3098 domain-containing protein [Bacteroidia bacterium]|nr:DUF3098 domain-containing protein [Bacteroidia bacterium]
MENQEKQSEVRTGGFALSKKGVPVILGGVLMVIIGFVLMSGGGSQDPHVFNPEIFSSTRITVAPLLILAGFTVTGVGIMLKSKN